MKPISRSDVLVIVTRNRRSAPAFSGSLGAAMLNENSCLLADAESVANKISARAQASVEAVGFRDVSLGLSAARV